MNKEKASISQYLKTSYILIIVMMAVPTIVLSIFIPTMNRRYSDMIGYVRRASEVIEVTDRQLEKEIWDIVAGKKDFGDGKQYELLDSAQDILKQLKENIRNDSQRYIVGAMEMLDSIRSYCDELGMQIRRNVAVSSNEQLLREIRRVSSSLKDVMIEYIYAEIDEISVINSNILNITTFNILLTGVLMGLVIWFAIRCYQSARDSIQKPIARLEKMSVRLAKGELSARSPASALEELDVLTQSLNSMAHKLEELIDSRVQDQRNLRKAELRTLQEQITPHFIYNTLDTIVWMAQKKKTEDVIGITMALTKFLRISLSKGNDWITVEQEIGHVESYLKIQQFRYRGKIKYVVDIDPQLYGYGILKLLLQPLVENALYHGVKQKRGAGKIEVRGIKNRDNTMTFSVSDNGIGMTEERFKKVLTSMKNDIGLRDSAYGLYNVNKRISLYYENEGLSIESRYNVGTTVWFTIPYKEI